MQVLEPFPLPGPREHDNNELDWKLKQLGLNPGVQGQRTGVSDLYVFFPLYTCETASCRWYFYSLCSERILRRAVAFPRCRLNENCWVSACPIKWENRHDRIITLRRNAEEWEQHTGQLQPTQVRPRPTILGFRPLNLLATTPFHPGSSAGLP